MEEIINQIKIFINDNSGLVWVLSIVSGFGLFFVLLFYHTKTDRLNILKNKKSLEQTFKNPLIFSKSLDLLKAPKAYKLVKLEDKKALINIYEEGETPLNNVELPTPRSFWFIRETVPEKILTLKKDQILFETV